MARSGAAPAFGTRPPNPRGFVGVWPVSEPAGCERGASGTVRRPP